jgi:chromosome segregation ATPase
MATNGTWIDEDVHHLPKAGAAATPRAAVDKEAAPDLALAPLVDKIAYGLARGLVVAFKELENHIASETRSVGDNVGRRLDSLQASFQDLSDGVSQQRAMSLSVQEQCQQLAAATTSLQESDARQAADLAALRGETRELSQSVSERIDVLQGDTGRRLDTLQAGVQELKESDAHQASELAALRGETRELSASVAERIDVLCKELGVQQEDISAVKSTLGGFSARVDTVMERLDRQADALRSIYSTYAQRETELEQLVDGLARLRSYPAPSPVNPL